ncbi:galactose-3-O-sulfotransferase 3-like [Ptychodera flava]|uniref:galactose-3-O-sulfotransferase 3-like n=1 Tax=Ptychodera flava TaxID=63121 RepID=UPI00396AACAB
MGRWKMNVFAALSGCTLLVILDGWTSVLPWRKPEQSTDEEREITNTEENEIPTTESQELTANYTFQHQKNVAGAPKGNLCQPINKFIFVKTEKTGGSTLASLLFRYGLKNNLVAALHPDGWFAIKYNKSSESYAVVHYNCTDFPGYDFIANHIIYKRVAMENIIENATYITILRSPYNHIRSRFFFYKRYKPFRNLTTDSESFSAYLKSKKHNFDVHGSVSWDLNSLSDRLGILQSERALLMDSIKKIDQEFDLVMLTEYFDESLILLRKLMCWDFEDILYYSQKVHKTALPTVTIAMKNIIDKLSTVDIQLYNHFNTTFWKRVRNYEGDFEADLTKFRKLKRNVTDKCELERKSDFCNLFIMDDYPITKVTYERQLEWMCTDT